MKKIYLPVLSVLLMLLLCACSPLPGETIATVSPPEQATQDDPSAAIVPMTVPVTVPTEAATVSAEDQQAVTEAFREVLAGGSFTDSFSGIPLQLDTSDNTISDPFGVVATPIHFLLLDLDGDGTQELLLWLRVGQDEYGGFWVMRYEGGHVVGYSMTYRNFDKLKQDGSYQVSNSPEDYGIGRIQFAEDSWEFIYTARYKAALYGDGSVAEYACTIDGAPGTLEEFNTAFDRHCEKPNAVWLEYTRENLVQAGLA